jgi:hypothetical protein
MKLVSIRRVQSCFVRLMDVGAICQDLGDAGILILGELGNVQFPQMYERLSWRQGRTLGAQQTGNKAPDNDREKEATD